MDNSTGIAEEIDDLVYHKFLNQFFIDITESILFTKGEIYQYVGDEIVVTWNMETGFKNANCVFTYFYALQIIDGLQSKYLKKFGIQPSFKTSLHCGPVIRAEVGDVKSEIVYHGDVVNTTARIERLCSKLKEPFLISENIYNALPAFIQKQFISKGDFALRGKEINIEIFGLKEKDANFLTPENEL